MTFLKETSFLREQNASVEQVEREEVSEVIYSFIVGLQPENVSHFSISIIRVAQCETLLQVCLRS